MVFNDKKIDEVIKNNKKIQLSFLTKQGHDHYKDKFINEGYYNLTDYFIENSPQYINIRYLKEITSKHNTFICINEIYNHYVIKGNKPYNQITHGFYLDIKTLTDQIEKKIIVLAYKRKLNDCIKYKIEILDNTFFCDFADLYIYPVYHEYKLFTQDINVFNNFVDEVSETGEIPNQYNVCLIQYMKLNATEKVFY